MKQKLKKMGYWASVITLGLVVGISLQMVRANWTAPAAQAPNGNIGAPINTGNNVQIKSGTLQVDGSLVSGALTPIPNPAPNGQSLGNMYANDVYINSASKWASQLGGANLGQSTCYWTGAQWDAWDAAQSCNVGYYVAGFRMQPNNGSRENWFIRCCK